MKSLVALLVAAAAIVQPAVFKPGDNLVVEGVPPVPQSIVEKAELYTQFRAAGLDAWHPSEHRMLINTRFADTSQVHEVDMPGGARTQLTFYRDRISGASFPRTGGDFFVFSKDRGGDEFFQNYRYDLANKNVAMFTDGKSRNSEGAWSHAHQSYAYGSTRRNGTDVDFYICNPAEPSSDRLLCQNQGGGWAVLDWSPDDRQLVAQEYISINESYLWLVDTTTGAKKLLTPKTEKKVAWYGAQYSPDGKGVYTTTDRDSEFRQLAYTDLATHNVTYLSSEIPWDVTSFDLTDDGRYLAFATNEDGRSILHVLDTASKKMVTLPQLPPGSVGSAQWHNDNHTLGFVAVNSETPSDVYSLDMAGGGVQRWTHSETGPIDTSGFVEPELIKWNSFDGRTISGFLFKPPAKFTGKHPVIINIHGGPESQFRPGYLGQSNYYLNELGIAMIYPNVRGSSGYGKTFLTLDNGFNRMNSVKDIGALLDWIKTQPDLDADRIMVTGGSYGGFMTLAVATNYNDRIRCSVDVVGPSNLVTFLEHTQGYRRDLRRVEYGDERDPKMRAFLDDIAPANHADKITKPMFVIQGKNDPRVPATESEQMVAAIRKHGTPVWFLMADDEGHGFAKKKNQDYQFYATVLFIQKYLL